MVTIRKQLQAAGTIYEIEDFSAYTAELRQRNIDVPSVKYSVVIAPETEQAVRTACMNLEEQIASFFLVGPTSGIEYQIHEA